MSMKLSRGDFPPDFVFGAATSSYQIEGRSFGGAGRTHWDDFAATPGNVVRAEHGQIACDHFYRMDEDLDLMAGLNVDAYRFSTSWARVVPEGRGAVNEAGLDFYDRLVDGLLERGIKPAATLYHWELPSPLADAGGWRNRDIASWFGDFTEVIMGRIGDRVWSVAPINEPWCVGWLSHFLGAHAPGLRDIDMIRTLCDSVTAPVNVIMGAPGVDLSVDALSDAGVARISVGSAFARLAYGSFIHAAEEVMKGTFGQTGNAMGFADIEKRLPE